MKIKEIFLGKKKKFMTFKMCAIFMHLFIHRIMFQKCIVVNATPYRYSKNNF